MENMMNMKKYVERYTNAPQSYDYGNTEFVTIVGETHKGELIRKVRIYMTHPKSMRAVLYQEARYNSGLYFVVSSDFLRENGDLLGNVSIAP